MDLFRNRRGRAIDEWLNRKADKAKVKGKVTPMGVKAFRKAKKALERAKPVDDLRIILPWKMNVPEVCSDYSKDGAFTSAYAFGVRLQKKGFKKLGSGLYSVVYGHPSSDKVIKVSHREDNWIDYVKWGADKGYAGDIVPKVYSYKKIRASNSEYGHFSVAVVERLEATLADHDHEIVKKNKDSYSVICDLMWRGLQGNDIALITADYVKPGIAKFGEEMREEFGTNCGYDLHKGNWMVRKNGGVVLTDPITCVSVSNNYTRLYSRDFPSTYYN